MPDLMQNLVLTISLSALCSASCSDSTPICDPSLCTDSVALGPDEGLLKVVQNFSNALGTIEISLALKIGDVPAPGETFGWELERFSFCNVTQDLCIIDPEQMKYVWTHHNQDETLTAVHGSRTFEIRTIYEWGADHDQDRWNDTLEVQPPFGSSQLGPMKLIDRGCRTVPPGNPNGCKLRERLDE